MIEARRRRRKLFKTKVVNKVDAEEGSFKVNEMKLIQICRISGQLYSGIRKYRSRPLA